MPDEARSNSPPCSARLGTTPGALWARNLQSDAAMYPGDFALCDLRRDQPGVKRVADTVSASPVPTLRRENLYVELLAGGEINILVLIGVAVIAHRGDTIVPSRKIAVERATVCYGPEITAVDVDICEVKALRGLPVAVEPDPALPRQRLCRGWKLRRDRRIGAGYHDHH